MGGQCVAYFAIRACSACRHQNLESRHAAKQHTQGFGTKNTLALKIEKCKENQRVALALVWLDEVCKDLLINKICEMTCYQKTLQNMQKSFLLNGPWRILAHNLWETSLADWNQSHLSTIAVSKRASTAHAGGPSQIVGRSIRGNQNEFFLDPPNISVANIIDT